MAGLSESEKYETFNNFAKECNSVRVKATENFEKNLISLSTAVLTFQTTFGVKDRDLNWLIYAAWISETISVVCVLITYFIASYGLVWTLEQTRLEIFEGGPENRFAANKAHDLQMILNAIAAATFVLGLILSAFYMGSTRVKKNVQEKDNVNSKTNGYSSQEEELSPLVSATHSANGAKAKASDETEAKKEGKMKFCSEIKQDSLQPAPPKMPKPSASEKTAPTNSPAASKIIKKHPR